MSTPTDGPNPSQLTLTDLTVEQLQQVRQQLDQELQHLTNAFQELRLAQLKFAACLDSLHSLKKPSQDKNVLIPLTSSLYVPGKIKDPEHVLVDIGTGYYVEKTTKQAKTYYNQKNLTLRSSLATLQGQIGTKEDNLRAAMSVYNQKLATRGAAPEEGQRRIEK
ncbi:BQ2448_2944 [Microbotryum intermedium]|uniref:BQ2448_2944 protein n=1 Tax=Microbotryum intermedium TaxID=269621 RepID=A0A238FJV5_9BASI|nr:BQ2448_2944 [Microbotryum intermedium]